MNILIPTDFSESSNVAIDYAVQLAIKKNDNISLLHTYKLKYNDIGLFLDFDDSIKEIAKEEIDEKLASLKNQYPQLSTSQLKGQLIMGNLSDVIEDIHSDFDLVVMGSKGKTGLEKVLIGSETARVIGSTSIPTLIIPASCKFENNDELFFAIDLKESLKRIELELIQNLSTEEKRIHLYHNYHDALEISVNEEKDLLKDFKNYFPGTITTIDLDFSTDKLNAIEDAIEEHQPKLVVVKAKHRKLLQSFFHKSISKELSYHTKQPLLVLKG